MNKYQEIVLKQALHYASMGWHILPCKKNKRPYNFDGSKGATTDEDQIYDWWQQWPSANIGVATGKRSGFFVVDIDIKDGKDGTKTIKSLFPDENLDRDKNEIAQQTPTGGLHLFYKCGDEEIHNSQNNDKISGIDIRGEGGYVLVSPSSCNVNNEWIEYQMKGDVIAEPPNWVIRLLAIFKESRGTLNIEKIISTGLTQGERDDGLFRFGCVLNQNGIPFNMAELFLLEAGARAIPPFNESEVREKLQSAYSYKRTRNVDTSKLDKEIDGKQAELEILKQKFRGAQDG